MNINKKLHVIFLNFSITQIAILFADVGTLTKKGPKKKRTNDDS
jgi:hypothetical protein